MNLGISWSAAANLFFLSIPSHLMAYYPFRDHLRVSFWKVLLPVCLLQAAQSLLYGYMVFQGGSGGIVFYGCALIYIAIYFASVRGDHFKVLFLYLFVTDYTMIQRGIAAFLETRFFYRPGMDYTTWTSTALNLTVLVLTAPFMLRLLSGAREKAFSVDAPRFWRTAWMVPAFTTMIVMAFTKSFTAEEVGSLRFLFARVLMLLCAFVVYYTLLAALDGVRRQAALTEQAGMQEQLLSLQRTQHEQLVRHMEETREIRHEIRQHLNVMGAYLEQKDTRGAKAYLDAYARTLPADIRRTFTKNFALNAVCLSYGEEARKYEIDYDVELDFPEHLPISEPELCALLGNLLENAVDACRKAAVSAPFIRVRGICEENQVVLTVDNSCEKEPHWKAGRLLSSKREGFGTGTWMVQRTAEKSGGTASFAYEDGVFFASVLLYG